MPRVPRSSALRWAWLPAIAIWLTWCPAPCAAEIPPADLARGIREAGKTHGGLIVQLGCDDGRLTAALRADDSCLVLGLERDADRVAAARREIRAAGQYGPVSVQTWSGDRLPFPDHFVNLLVVSAGCSTPRDELLRVLVPGGTAVWVARAQVLREPPPLVKPWPAEMDQWTHNAHGPDGNPVAKDRLVGPPQHYQWLAEPLWQRGHDTDSSVSAMVSAGGRLFSIEDQAPIGVIGQHALPDQWCLVARDAFNGTPLWKRPIEHWGWREWKDSWFLPRPAMMPLSLPRRLVAAGDRVYVTLGYRAPLEQLDAASGKTLQTYAGSAGTNEVLYHDGVLIGSTPVDGKLQIRAVEAGSGHVRWETPPQFRGTTHEEIRWGEMYGAIRPPTLDPAVNLATDGALVCLIDGPDLVALDYATGRLRWRTTPPADVLQRAKPGRPVNTDLLLGSVIAAGPVVLYADPHRLMSLSADTGKLLWTTERQGLGFYSAKDLFVIQGLAWTWSAASESAVHAGATKKSDRARWPTWLNGYDLASGAIRKQIPLGNLFNAPHHHRCYPNHATERYVIASRRGSEFLDLESGQHSVNNWVRGTCHLGMFFANGLQYAPPHPCVCYLQEKLNGLNALAAAHPDDPPPLASTAPPLQRGPAYNALANLPAAIPDPQSPIPNPQSPIPAFSAWPTYRHDPARTSSTPERLGEQFASAWTTSLGGKLTPPIVVDNRLYVARIDQHELVALDARDGRVQWTFTAGGRIDSPPTWHAGRLLLGCCDGWVYCLRAADGALAWRFRAAPAERFIGAFGQLESAWPVHGSVLVQNGVCYAAAGRTSHLDGGIYVFALDPLSGALLHQARLEGPAPDMDAFRDNFVTNKEQGFLTDVPVGDGRRIYFRDTAFNADLTRAAEGSGAHLVAAGGMLDDNYFNRITWGYVGGKEPQRGQLLAYDEHALYGVEMLSPRCLDPAHYFTPGKDGYTLQAKPLAAMEPIPVANSASLSPNNQPLSVLAWVHAEQPDGAILARGGAAAGYCLVLRGGKPQFAVRAGEKLAAATGPASIVGRWTHVAGVITAEKELRLYVDGALVAAARGMFCGNPGQAMEIGGDLGTAVGDYQSPFLFTGRIDEVSIYHRALSEAEIGRQLTAPGAAPGAALYYSFDGGDARDESGNGNDGRAGRRQAAEGKFGRAMQFAAAAGEGWKRKMPVRVQAMLAASNVLVVAGPPDRLDLAAFQGRAGGRLEVLAAHDGRALASVSLPDPPVFNGVAAAGGRLFLSTTGGTVACLRGQ